MTESLNRSMFGNTRVARTHSHSDLSIYIVRNSNQFSIYARKLNVFKWSMKQKRAKFILIFVFIFSTLSDKWQKRRKGETNRMNFDKKCRPIKNGNYIKFSISPFGAPAQNVATQKE